MKEENASSAGAVYVISLKSKESYTLIQPERVNFQGIPCIKGKNGRAGNWLEGKTMFIPVENIGVFREFSSDEDYKAAAKKYYDKKNK